MISCKRPFFLRMKICNRLVHPDDHLQEVGPSGSSATTTTTGVWERGHQVDRGDGIEGGVREEEILAHGRMDQSNVVQEVLADLQIPFNLRNKSIQHI